ncbi:carbohydrate ABC transporter substrate-binding protein (CUT1 family) [Haloarcula quadrata]|uniref:Carbohydrate ABC transporter substrate-binding protein (CUT1 family) n=2 Tax=Haloarcula quadrata TaxID=182779 RepID=A0A495QVF1_9EURY|nr:ABC transporter substrate-binding protein [Haloarcula quadrata]RKS78084.1 carbohydrate ABC transporter substrate-binding protein (CUT1 family) [Haloarcula quadrata]
MVQSGGGYDGVSRRSVLKASGTALTVGTVGLAGCSSSSGASVRPVNEDSLTIWHAMGGTNGETLQGLVDQFQSETDINANLVFQDSYEGVLTNTLSALDSGEVPDVFQIDSLFAQQVLDTDAVEPVENLLSDDYPVDDFLPNVTSFFTIDDTLTSMPFNNSNAILYYNRSAFKEAGLDPDSPPTTLEEVRSYSQTLVDEGVTEAGLTWPNHVWFVEHFYSVDGQTLLDAENGHAGQPTTMQTDNSTARSLYEWWHEMADNGLFSNPGIEAWGEATSTFLTGKAAMLMTSTASVTGIRSGAEENGFEVDNAFYPTIDGDRTGPVIGGASWFVPSGLPQERQDDIGSFLEFMGRPESQITWHKGTGYYPIRQSAVEQLENDGWFAENPMYRTAFDQLTQAESTPATKRMLIGPARQVQTTIQDMSVELFSGDVSVDEGLSELKSAVEDELDRYYS